MNFIHKPFRYRNVNGAVILILINALVFGAEYLYPQLSGFLTMTPYFVLKGEVWRFVTYMFAHASFSHIFFNMLGLYIFGTQLERYMGSAEFLTYYLVTGLLAGVFSFCVYLVTGSLMFSLLGASGALFAIQLAYAVLFPDAVIYIWGILPLRAPVMVLVFTGLELFSLLTGFNSGVAHLTHLAGCLFGWLYFLIRFRINPWTRLVRSR